MQTSAFYGSLLTLGALALSTFPAIGQDGANVDYRLANTIDHTLALVDARRAGVDSRTIADLLGKPLEGNEFDQRKAVQSSLDFIESESKVSIPLGIVVEYRSSNLISEFDFENGQFYVCFPGFYLSAPSAEWKREGSLRREFLWDMDSIRSLLPNGQLTGYGCPSATDNETNLFGGVESEIRAISIPLRVGDLDAAENLSRLRDSGRFFSSSYCIPNWQLDDAGKFGMGVRIGCSMTRLELTFVDESGEPKKVFEAALDGGSWKTKTDEALLRSVK